MRDGAGNNKLASISSFIDNLDEIDKVLLIEETADELSVIWGAPKVNPKTVNVNLQARRADPVQKKKTLCLPVIYFHVLCVKKE